MGWEAISLGDQKEGSILWWTPIRLLKFNFEGPSLVNLRKMDLQRDINDENELLMSTVLGFLLRLGFCPFFGKQPLRGPKDCLFHDDF